MAINNMLLLKRFICIRYRLIFDQVLKMLPIVLKISIMRKQYKYISLIHFKLGIYLLMPIIVNTSNNYGPIRYK